MGVDVSEIIITGVIYSSEEISEELVEKLIDLQERRWQKQMVRSYENELKVEQSQKGPKEKKDRRSKEEKTIEEYMRKQSQQYYEHVKKRLSEAKESTDKDLEESDVEVIQSNVYQVEGLPYYILGRVEKVMRAGERATLEERESLATEAYVREMSGYQVNPESKLQVEKVIRMYNLPNKPIKTYRVKYFH